MGSPSGIWPATLRLAVSITVTAPESQLDTYVVRPSGANTMPTGCPGAGIVATTACVVRHSSSAVRIGTTR